MTELLEVGERCNQYRRESLSDGSPIIGKLLWKNTFIIDEKYFHLVKLFAVFSLFNKYFLYRKSHSGTLQYPLCLIETCFFFSFFFFF